MNPEKIGQFIKQIRLQENLSQQQFAQKYGVTYQAVSKWENGKNIPDLSILKQMCEEYHINLDDFLETKITHKKRISKIWIWMIIIFSLLGIVLLFLFFKKDDPFQLKGLSATCNNFNLYGSIAYNNTKTSIYISNITYCGENNPQYYQKIDCILYETDERTKTEISRYDYKSETLITLDEFLKNVKFNVDHYEQNCKIYKENSLYLEIEAVDHKNQITTYKIPLQLEEDCN